MSAIQIQKEISQLEDEIATLEKKRAGFERKEADKTKKINDIRKSITKNTSGSMFSSKSRQIQNLQNELAELAKDKANISMKIADKQKKRTDKSAKLQRELKNEKLKEERSQKTIQKSYEHRINALTSQVNNQMFCSLSTTISAQNNVSTDEYDVFISHAWEDKVSFVDEFVTELERLDIRVWYDRQQIGWGDSMRAKIDTGLGKSRFGIAVISPNYIAEGKYWTKAELDGIFQLESINGKVLLPIWHNITKKEVVAYSPIIGGRLAMTTATMTPKEIADELVKQLRLKEEEITDEQ